MTEEGGVSDHHLPAGRRRPLVSLLAHIDLKLKRHKKFVFFSVHYQLVCRFPNISAGYCSIGLCTCRYYSLLLIIIIVSKGAKVEHFTQGQKQVLKKKTTTINFLLSGPV